MESLTAFLSGGNALFWGGVPDVIKGIVIALVISLLFYKQIKKYAVYFYILPGLLFAWYAFYGIASACGADLYSAMGESLLWELLWLPHSYTLDTLIGIGFICIVMFIGVLPKNDAVKKLFTIRFVLMLTFGLVINWAWIGQPASILITPIWDFAPAVDPDNPIVLASGYSVASCLFAMKIYLFMIIVSYVCLRIRKTRKKMENAA